jgi:hypothetical protein
MTVIFSVATTGWNCTGISIEGDYFPSGEANGQTAWKNNVTNTYMWWVSDFDGWVFDSGLINGRESICWKDESSSEPEPFVGNHTDFYYGSKCQECDDSGCGYEGHIAWLYISRRVELIIPTTTSSDVVSQVKMTMVIQNVNFDDLASDTTVKDTFKTNVKAAVAAEAGADVLPEHVEVVVSAGSVKVETTITCPAGVDATALSTSLGSSSTSLTSAVVDKIKEDPALVAMASGSISAAVTVAPAAVAAATTTTLDEDPYSSGAFRATRSDTLKATCCLLGLLSLL